MSEKQKIHISVCMGTNCTFRGAAQLVETLKKEEGINEYCVIEEIPCADMVCDHSKRSPVVKIEEDFFLEARPESILDEVYRRIPEKQEV